GNQIIGQSLDVKFNKTFPSSSSIFATAVLSHSRGMPAFGVARVLKMWLSLRSLHHLQRPTRHAELIDGAELSPGFAAIIETGDHAGIAIQQWANLFGGFSQQVDPESAQSHFSHASNEFGTALSHAVEDRVPATRIGKHGEVCSDAIAQFDLVVIARPPAIAGVLPGAEESREYTMPN